MKISRLSWIIWSKYGPTSSSSPSRASARCRLSPWQRLGFEFVFAAYQHLSLPPEGRSTKFWSLQKVIFYGPLHTSTAIQSSIFLGPPHIRALGTQSPFSPQSDTLAPPFPVYLYYHIKMHKTFQKIILKTNWVKTGSFTASCFTLTLLDIELCL